MISIDNPCDAFLLVRIRKSLANHFRKSIDGWMDGCLRNLIWFASNTSSIQINRSFRSKLDEWLANNNFESIESISIVNLISSNYYINNNAMQSHAKHSLINLYQQHCDVFENQDYFKHKFWKNLQFFFQSQQDYDAQWMNGSKRWPKMTLILNCLFKQRNLHSHMNTLWYKQGIWS